MSKQMPDIPGYYYDEEKRRYFRQVSSQQNPRPQPSATTNTPSACPVKTEQSHRIYDFVTKRQCDAHLPTRSLYECLASSMIKKDDIYWLPTSDLIYCYGNIAINQFGNALAVKKYMPFFRARSSVFSLESDKHGYVHQERIYDVITTTENEEARSLEFLSAGDGTEALLSREVYIITLNSQQLRPPTCLSSKDVNVNGFVNTVTWNRTQCDTESPSFFLGCYDGSVHLKAPGSHQSLRCLKASWKSPVLSLGCHTQSPLLYAGYRNGGIVIWDLRDKSRYSWSTKEPAAGKVPSSVIGLHPLSDSNYLLSNAFNSKLGLWDIRMKSKTLHFREHTNSYMYCKSIVDSAETFVAAAGNDLAVRLWSLKSGELLQSITYPTRERTENQHPPVICYTESFGGRHTNPVLLVAYNYDGVTTLSTFSIQGCTSLI